MPCRVKFVKRARKAIPAAGIAVGDSYYWWKFRFGSKQVSKTRPRPSQTESNEFLSGVYAQQETIEDEQANVVSIEGLKDFAATLESAASEIRELGQGQSDKLDNMPEGLQQGETGQRLQEQSEQAEQLADDLENAASELQGLELEDLPEDATPEQVSERELAIQSAIDEAMSNVDFSSL